MTDSLGLQIVYAHIFGLAIWHERETAFGVAGTILTVGGAFGATLEQKAHSKPSVSNSTLSSWDGHMGSFEPFTSFKKSSTLR